MRLKGLRPFQDRGQSIREFRKKLRGVRVVVTRNAMNLDTLSSNTIPPERNVLVNSMLLLCSNDRNRAAIFWRSVLSNSCPVRIVNIQMARLLCAQDTRSI